MESDPLPDLTGYDFCYIVASRGLSTEREIGKSLKAAGYVLWPFAAARNAKDFLQVLNLSLQSFLHPANTSRALLSGFDHSTLPGTPTTSILNGHSSTRGERQCQSITSEQQHVRVKNIRSLLNIINNNKKRYKQHRTMRRYHTDTNTDTKSCILPLHSHPQPAKCSSHSTKQYPKSLKLERCIYFSTCLAMSTVICVCVIARFWCPSLSYNCYHYGYHPLYLVKRIDLTSVWANVLYKSHY